MIFCFGNINLEESGFFNGLTDCHSHILPGVDDGFRTLDDSLAALSEYERLGISKVWLTPHVMEDVPNHPDDLRKRFAGLKESYGGPVELHLGAENMMDSLFVQRLKAGEVLPVDGGRILVETSRFNPPIDLDEMLFSVSSSGHIPLLAHPERYLYMNMSDYAKFKKSMVQFQLNLGSLTGMYGEMVMHRAQKLLRLGYYDCIGTDLHTFPQLRILCRSSIKKKLLSLCDFGG